MARRGGSGRISNPTYVASRRDAARDFYIDRRLWHPDKPDVPVSSSLMRDASRLVVRSPKVVARKRSHFERRRNDRFVSYLVGFAVPDFVSVCLRRKERREVLHAKRKTGKGSGGGRKLRGALSGIVC